MKNFEQGNSPEKNKITVIRINGAEHNLKNLIDLLNKNGLKIENLFAQDPREGAEKRITKDFIPAMLSQLKVSASYNEVKNVLETSDEFRPYIDKLLGSI